MNKKFNIYSLFPPSKNLKQNSSSKKIIVFHWRLSHVWFSSLFHSKNYQPPIDYKKSWLLKIQGSTLFIRWWKKYWFWFIISFFIKNLPSIWSISYLHFWTLFSHTYCMDPKNIWMKMSSYQIHMYKYAYVNRFINAT